MSEATKNTALKEQFEGEVETVKEVASQILDTTEELIEQVDEKIKDFSSKSLKELLQFFEELIEKADQQEMYKYADAIKATFYKTLKKEKIAMGFQVPNDAVNEAVVEENNDGTEGAVDENQISVNPFAEIERGFKELYSKYRALRNEFISDLEKKKEENLAERLAIIEAIKNLSETQEDLHMTFPEFKNLQNRWRETGPIPQARVKDVYDTYNYVCEMFYDYVKINNELRDLDFKKNLESKLDLCEKAESLLNNENIITAFNELQILHEQWKELGPVAREQRELVWDRFKAATSKINKNHQTYFESLKVDQKNNLSAKSALCEKAEEIAAREIVDSNAWNTASKDLENLQKEWKSIGFASKKDNQKIYDRFREACDNFYNRKREYYSEFKDQMTQNMERKISICEQAEAIMDSTDWKKTSDQLINLQKQWKEIGPVSRKKSELIWNRFRAACDKFFDNKEKNHAGVDPKFVENLHQKEALLEEIRNISEDSINSNTLKEIMAKWNEIGFVPFKEKDKIAEEFKSLISEKFSAFKPSFDAKPSGRRKPNDRNSYRRREQAPISERDKFIQRYRKIESEIQTYENNMGFFASSKNADAILSEMQNKIVTAKQELNDLAQKIKELDN